MPTSKILLLFTFLILPSLSSDEDIGWKKGEFLPDIAYITHNGELTSLHKQKGKAIFVNFWATWCPPCIREWPIIQKAYNDLKDNEKVEFLLFNLYETYPEGVEWSKSKGYSVPLSDVMYDERNIKHRSKMALTHSSGKYIDYERQYIPTSFILNPEGKIIKRYYEKGLTKWGLKKTIAKALK